MGCAASSCEHQEVSSVSADNRSDLEGTDDAPRLIVTDGISIGNITSEKPECTTESLLGHSPLQSKDASDERAACTAEALQIFGGDDSVWETDSTLEKTISLVQLNGIRIFGGGFSEDSDPLGMGSASASTVGSAGSTTWGRRGCSKDSGTTAELDPESPSPSLDSNRPALRNRRGLKKLAVNTGVASSTLGQGTKTGTKPTGAGKNQR